MTNEFEIGEAVTEIEAERAPEVDCDCKEGMFPNGKIATASRRQILRGGGLLTAAAAIMPVRAMAADAPSGGSIRPGACRAASPKAITASAPRSKK